MFLTPVLAVALVGGRRVARWSYLLAFGAAMLGALAYHGRGWPVFAALLPEGHKYQQLLIICLCVLASGFAAVLAGSRRG